jgi:peptidoglycan hydrolase CwlO-like protein
MKRNKIRLLAALLIGAGMTLKTPLVRASEKSEEAAEEKATDQFERHHNVHDIYGEVSSLEKSIKRDQATIKNKPSDGNVTVMRSDKAKLNKHIALCRAEIRDLNARLDTLEKETPGSTQ